MPGIPEVVREAKKGEFIVHGPDASSGADASALEVSEDLEHLDEDLIDFEAAARRPLAQHMHNSFIKTYKPVLDDAPYRAFATMAEYRAWCAEALPDWLGYGRV